MSLNTIASNPRETLVIILHFGSLLDTDECLASLYRFVSSPFSTIVINNGSEHEVECMLKKKHPQVLYRYAGINAGFAEGNNVGLRFALENQFTYSLLLNNDTVAEEDFLAPLIKVAEQDAAIGLAGPALLFYSDKKRLWSCGGDIRWLSGHMTGKLVMPVSSNDKGVDVDYLPGACILARNDAVRSIGLMNEKYFLGVEEADWAIRARKHGFRVVACANSRLFHKVGMSSQQTPALIYNSLRNRLLFLQAEHSFPVNLVLVLRAAMGAVWKQWRHRRIMWRAMRDHFRYKNITRAHLETAKASAANIGT